jgi:L-threonylcarbamoyladenylate synthase
MPASTQVNSALSACRDARLITWLIRNTIWRNTVTAKAQIQANTWRFKMIANRLFEGEVIAYPTEGVWGLGCVPEKRGAVERILLMKRRRWQQGLILVASDLAQCEPYMGSITDMQRAALTQAWPGPITFLVPRSARVPDWIAGDSDRVALRVSNHPVIAGICSRLGQPMVSTSANPSGKPVAMTRLKLTQYFKGAVDTVVPGQLGGLAGASEIRDLVSGEILRPAKMQGGR